MEEELALVVGYIMYNDLLQGTRYRGFFSKIDKVLELSKEFIVIYPKGYNWEDSDDDWSETLEAWIFKKLDE